MTGRPTAECAAGQVGEGRLRRRSAPAYAHHDGTAPLPVWSGNRERHRLARTGNRQLNAALHRIAITQAHYHPDARAYLQRRKEAGTTSTEAIRALRRRLSDVVYRALLNDARILTDRSSLQQAA
ncbi:transposase [Streptomyces sp. NPDC056190]|uniref:transposase n=1 Tax=unclassified Streptomyces TaxID=2593676 RepID=UPI0035E0B1BE